MNERETVLRSEVLLSFLSCESKLRRGGWKHLRIGLNEKDCQTCLCVSDDRPLHYGLLRTWANQTGISGAIWLLGMVGLA